jgi:hypothetical protein
MNKMILCCMVLFFSYSALAEQSAADNVLTKVSQEENKEHDTLLISLLSGSVSGLTSILLSPLLSPVTGAATFASVAFFEQEDSGIESSELIVLSLLGMLGSISIVGLYFAINTVVAAVCFPLYYVYGLGFVLQMAFILLIAHPAHAIAQAAWWGYLMPIAYERGVRKIEEHKNQQRSKGKQISP